MLCVDADVIILADNVPWEEEHTCISSLANQLTRLLFPNFKNQLFVEQNPCPLNSTFLLLFPLAGLLIPPLRRSACVIQQRKSQSSQIPAQTAPYTPEKNRRGRRILCYLLWGRILRGGKQSDSPAAFYVENTQKKPDFFHAITHSFTSTTSSDKRFRRGVSNFPAEKNTRSHSAEVGGMECMSCAH